MKIIDWIFEHQEQIGVLFATACVAWCLIQRKKSKQPTTEATVGPLIVGALAAYTIPQGILLFYCCFDKSKLDKIADLPLYLGVASLCAIVLSALVVVKSIKESKNDPPTRQG